MIRKIIIITLILVVSSFNIFSQLKSLESSKEMLFNDNAKSMQSQQKLFGSENTPVGNAVNPEIYIVGPGDIFSIMNLTSSFENEYIKVSPENTVLVPRVGELIVKDLNLKDFRKLVIESIKKINPNALISVSLFQPRLVIVSITGNVTNPGTYTLPATFQISTAIKLANDINTMKISNVELSNLSKIKENTKKLQQFNADQGLSGVMDFYLRNVSIRRYNGKYIQCDFEKAITLNNVDYDPYLIDGDDIYVPYNPSGYNQISITGAVLRPIILPFKSGDKLSFLVKSGLAFESNADLDDIYLTKGDGQRLKIQVNQLMELLSEDIELQSGANLHVGSVSTAASGNQGLVIISGNVRKPGSYLIVPNVTRFKDIIELAGGITEEAYLPLSYILRNSEKYMDNFSKPSLIYEKFQYSDLTLEDTTRWNIDASYSKPMVSCDLYEAIVHNSSSDNVLLLNGDNIVIASNPKSVFVFGQVNNPGYVTFEDKKNVDWYIEKAGGYAVSAEKSRVRVISGRTKVWKKGHDILVNAGDEIYIPKPPDYPPGIELQTYALIAGAIGALAAVLNVISYILRK